MSKQITLIGNKAWYIKCIYYYIHAGAFFDEKSDEYRVTLYSTTFQHSCCCFELALDIRLAVILLPRAKETHSDI